MSEPIKIKLILEARDFRKATWWLKRKGILAVVACVLIVWAALVAGRVIESGSPAGLIGGLLGGLGVTYFMFWLPTNNVAIQTRSYEVTFDDGGMKILPDNSPTLTTGEWEEFGAVRESNEALIFVTKDKQVFPIPKRCFADEVQLRYLRTLVRSHHGDKAKLNSRNV